MGNKQKQQNLKKLQREIEMYESTATTTMTKRAKGRVSLVDFLLWLLILFFAAVGVGIAFLLATGKWDATMDSLTSPKDNGNKQVAQGIALLQPTPNAGQEYIDATYFIGDSNTVRIGQFGLVDEWQIAAKQGLGIGGVVDDAIFYLDDEQSYTILQAVMQQQPSRILLTFGTNDIGNGATPESFAAQYQDVIRQLRTAIPHSIIVVNSIPPISQNNSYPKLSREEIDAFNSALLDICCQENVAFLNSQEALAGEDGYAKEGLTEADGVHYTKQGLQQLLAYYQTHAFLP